MVNEYLYRSAFLKQLFKLALIVNALRSQVIQGRSMKMRGLLKLKSCITLHLFGGIKSNQKMLSHINKGKSKIHAENVEKIPKIKESRFL